MLDGLVETYLSNVIAENNMSSINDKGNLFVLLDKIIDHQENDDALQEANAYIETKPGSTHLKPTTKGWDLLVSWRDGTSSWVCLADLKESSRYIFSGGKSG